MDAASAPMHFSLRVKKDMLHVWRKSGRRVIEHGVTEREMIQWDELERKYGDRGLQRSAGKLTLAELRVVPPPPLDIFIFFNPLGCIRKLEDKNGKTITEPRLPPAPRALYHVTKSLTQKTGICTRADLAHVLWPKHHAVLPDPKILDVMVCTANKRLAPNERIEGVYGRGYRFVALPA